MRWLPVGLVLMAGCSGGGDERAEPVAASRAALTITPSFALDLGPTASPRGEAPWGMTVAPTPTGSLVFNTAYGAGGGWFMVHQHDAAGAYVPGTLRGIRGSLQTIDSVTYPTLAARWDGAGVAAVWQTPGEPGVRRVLAMRLDPTGRPLDSAPIEVVPSGGPDLFFRSLACNASQCLVLLGVGTRLAFRRLSVDGRLLDPAPVTVTSASAGPVSVAALDDRFVVGWTETPPASTSDVRVARVGADGAVLDPGGRAIATAGGARDGITLLSDGTRVFARWQASASGPRPDATYTEVLDRDLVPLAPATAHPDLVAPSFPYAWWDGASWVLANGVSLVRFNRDGLRLDATPRTIARGESSRWLGGVVGGFVMLGYMIWPTSTTVTLERYDSTGARLGAPLLPGRYPSDAHPAIDFNGSEYAVAWDRDELVTQVARVSTAGVVRDVPSVPVGARPDPVTTFTAPVALALDGTTAHLFGTVPYNGASHLALDLATRTRVFYENYMMGEVSHYVGPVRGRGQSLLLKDALIRRLGPAWTRLDPAPILIASTPVFGSHADFDGTNYLVAFQNLIDGAYAMYVRRLGPDGDFVDAAPRSLRELGGVRSGPYLAYGGGQHLMVWVDLSHQVRAVRLALDGTPASGTPPVLGVVLSPFTSSFSYDNREVAVVFDGVSFVVTWTTIGSGAVRAARVSPSGAVLDAPALTLADSNTGGTPRVGVVAATDARGATLVAYEAFDPDLGALQVRGVFLRNDGAPALDAGTDVPDATSVVDAARDTGVDITVAADAARDTGVDITVAADAARDAGVDITVAADVARDAGVDITVAADAARDAGVDVTVAVDVTVPPRDAAPDVSVPDVGVAVDVAVPADAPDVADAGVDVASDSTADAEDATDAGATDVGADVALADATDGAVDGDDASDDVTGADDAAHDGAVDAPEADASTPPPTDSGCAARCDVGARPSGGGGRAVAGLALVAVLRRRRRATA